jgi:hypothetical protein
VNDAPILIIPGWNNSGPQHWQTLWEKAHPDYRRVEQDSWDKPRCGDWVARLDRYIAEAAAPPILVAHSLGSTAVAHWAAAHTRPVRGALLVVPPDLDSAAVFDEGGFTPVPRKRLPFPSVLVASADDPWCPMKVSEEFAEAWGSRLVNAGACGHLSTGAWPMGEALLAELAAMG